MVVTDLATASTAADENAPALRAKNRAMFLAGMVLLSVCLVVNLLLVLQHFDAAPLPGCGADSDCAAAAESVWGTLPGIGWPVSFVGFAYFQALWAAWWTTGGGWSRLLRWTVRAGALVSIVLTGAMIQGGYLCPYCLAVHALNLTFAVLQEFAARKVRRGPAQGAVFREARQGWLSFGGTMVLTSFVLLEFELESTAAKNRQIQLDLATSIEHVSAQSEEPEQELQVTPGRYILGPEDAKVHIVVFSDYECPSCRKIDLQLQVTAASRPEVSLSARHFPFCKECNDHVPATRHPSACRAARAAEAAGIVAGADGFWTMHQWLFHKKGQLTDEQLQEFLQGHEWSEEEFLQTMESDEVLRAIREDTQLADEIGLKYTPLVFLNGRQIEVGGADPAAKASPSEKEGVDG